MVQWEVIKNDGPWVARCRAHKLTAQGDTWEDLREVVSEITDAFFHPKKHRIVWRKKISTESTFDPLL